MEILLAEHFEQAYENLTGPEKRSVRRALSRLGENPSYPGLHVKKMQGRPNIWEARCSSRLRMTFEMTGATITMRKVGRHDEVLKNP